MICRGEVTDDDLKRLGANTIGDSANFRGKLTSAGIKTTKLIVSC